MASTLDLCYSTVTTAALSDFIQEQPRCPLPVRTEDHQYDGTGVVFDYNSAVAMWYGLSGAVEGVPSSDDVPSPMLYEFS